MNTPATTHKLVISRPVLLFAAFAAVYLVWGSTYLAIKYAIATLPPLLMAGGRFVLAGLVMSAIKRDRGVKDWGAAIPGHGGILDRIDSLVFSAPVFFHVTRFAFT